MITAATRPLAEGEQLLVRISLAPWPYSRRPAGEEVAGVDDLGTSPLARQRLPISVVTSPARASAFSSTSRPRLTTRPHRGRGRRPPAWAARAAGRRRRRLRARPQHSATTSLVWAGRPTVPAPPSPAAPRHGRQAATPAGSWSTVAENAGAARSPRATRRTVPTMLWECCLVGVTGGRAARAGGPGAPSLGRSDALGDADLLGAAGAGGRAGAAIAAQVPWATGAAGVAVPGVDAPVAAGLALGQRSQTLPPGGRGRPGAGERRELAAGAAERSERRRGSRPAPERRCLSFSPLAGSSSFCLGR